MFGTTIVGNGLGFRGSAEVHQLRQASHPCPSTEMVRYVCIVLFLNAFFDQPIKGKDTIFQVRLVF